MFNSLKSRIILFNIFIVMISILILTSLFSRFTANQMRTTLLLNAEKNVDFTKNYIQAQYNNIEVFKEKLIENKKKELSDTTDILFVRLDSIYNQYKEGDITKEDAINNMLDAVRLTRYDDGKGYFWIQNQADPPVMLMYATQPSLNGTTLDDPKFNGTIENNENIFEYAVQLTKENKEGYIDYLWYSEEDLVNRTAYVRAFEPFDWVIGTSFEFEEVSAAADELIINSIEELSEINDKSISTEGYFVIFDSNDNMKVHPTLKGMNVVNLLNPVTNQPITRDLMGVADFEGQYLDYLWDKPSDKDNYIYEKTAYVTYFEPFDWYIASTFYKDATYGRIDVFIMTITSVAVLLIITAAVISYWIGTGLTTPLMNLVEKLRVTNYDNMPVIDIKGTSEINSLSDSMNHMIESMKVYKKDILDAHYQTEVIMNSATHMAIVATDSKGLVTSFNIGAENLLGYKSEDVLLKETAELFHLQSELEERAEELSQIYMRKVSGFETLTLIPDEVGYEEKEWTFVNQDGTHFIVNLIVTRIVDSDGVIIGYLGLANNISARKEVEDKLNKRTEELKKAVTNLIVHEEHLEDMVRERTIKLEESLHTIQETQNQLIESEKMALLGSLVAGVAHEINTPVGIGVTLSSSLEERTSSISMLLEDNKLTKKNLVEYVDVVSEIAKMLSHTMNQAGELIQSFKLVAVDQSIERKREFDLCDYTTEIINSLGSKFSRSNVTIDVICDDLITIFSYPGTFYQIFTNLMMNSLHHGFENCEEGHIKLTLREIDEHIEIVYSDDGIGISEEEIQKIFEPFYTTKRNKGGTGLGLNIVNNLIYQKLFGSFTCESKLGVGTTFKIIIPKEKA